MFIAEEKGGRGLPDFMIIFVLEGLNTKICPNPFNLIREEGVKITDQTPVSAPKEGESEVGL